MPLQTDVEISSLLKTTKTIALEIASPKHHRDSNEVLRFLIDQGYEVYPVNPAHAGEKIAGREVYANLNDIPVEIDLVDIFRRSEFVEPIVQRAIDCKAKAIWMQLGVISTEAASQAKAAGMKVVMDRCPVIDIPRFKSLGLM